VLYDLRPLAERLADEGIGDDAADAVLHPPTVAFGDGFHPVEVAGTTSWHWARSTATLTVDNHGSDVLDVALTATLAAADPAGTTATVTIGDAEPIVLEVDADGRVLRRTVSLPPGTTTIRFEADGEEVRVGRDPRLLALQVQDLRLTPAAIADLWDVAGV
jgi:hypothetical protein